MSCAAASVPRRVSWLIAGALLLAACMSTPTASADLPSADNPPNFLVSCKDLTASLSPDNRFYTFVATASGAANAITGYRFDYGDDQSYTVLLRPNSTGDHPTAKVTHTYEKFGTYQAKVSVLYSTNNKTATATSPECQAAIAYGPPISVLPKTGVSAGIIALPAVVVVAATAAWHIRLRRATAKN